MNRQRVIETATQTWNQHRATEAQIRMYGPPSVGSIGAATLEETVAHFLLCAELQESNRLTVDAGRMWGKSRQEIEGWVAGRAAQERKRSGLKAVIRKYGRDGAERIVEKHAGRHISLR